MGRIYRYLEEQNIIYVGMVKGNDTSDILRRHKQHLHQDGWCNCHLKLEVLDFAPESELDTFALETHFINTYRPRYNKNYQTKLGKLNLKKEMSFKWESYITYGSVKNERIVKTGYSKYSCLEKFKRLCTEAIENALTNRIFDFYSVMHINPNSIDIFYRFPEPSDRRCYYSANFYDRCHVLEGSRAIGEEMYQHVTLKNMTPEHLAVFLADREFTKQNELSETYKHLMNNNPEVFNNRKAMINGIIKDLSLYCPYEYKIMTEGENGSK